MEADRAFFSPDFLSEFIEKYRSLPCLWKVKSVEYSTTVTRQKGWKQLTEFCKKINPTADTTWVKRKVQNIRGSFRKEQKKIASSVQSGAEVIYKPKLWYYDLLSFTKDVETPREFITIIDTDDEDTGHAAEEDQDVNTENAEAPPTLNDDDSSTNPDLDPLQRNQTWRSRPKRRRTDMDFAEDQEPLGEKSRLDFYKSDDEYDAVGKSVAAKLRKIANIDYMQFIYADKLINDVLYQATLQQLSPITVETKSKPEFYQVPTSTFENWNVTASSAGDSNSHFWVNATASVESSASHATTDPNDLAVDGPLDPSDSFISHSTENTSPRERKVFSEPRKQT